MATIKDHKGFLLLHLSVFIAGFTGVLGRLIELDPVVLVWHRMTWAAALMANYILARHGLPMIVVRSREKQAYLEALHQADLNVGTVSSDGAHATLNEIAPFARYFQGVVAN